MTQSYLVREEDNDKLSSNQKVIEWFVDLLDCAIRGRIWRAATFAVIELVDVR